MVGSEFVDAKYLLSPRDYDRVVEGSTVDILLPNNQIVTGTVSTIEVATENAKALTEVRVDSNELSDASLDNLTKTAPRSSRPCSSATTDRWPGSTTRCSTSCDRSGSSSPRLGTTETSTPRPARAQLQPCWSTRSSPTRVGFDRHTD